MERQDLVAEKRKGGSPANKPGTGRPANGGPAISLRGVALDFPSPEGGTLRLYEDFNLDVERGSFTVLLGPSGCGKSTLLNVIDGLIPATAADTVRVLGDDVRRGAQATRQIGYIFQSPRLLEWKTLKDNAIFGLRGLGLQPRTRWPELLEKYFRAVGLADYVDYYPRQVSGGMQQRAAIVRAWVNEPPILLMDEPFSHLDEITASQVRRELIDLWLAEERRRTVVFVTHDISEAVQLGSRVIVLTPRPMRLCHEEMIVKPWPRRSDDEDLFRVERKLRGVLSDQVGEAGV
ncbi:MAG: ABC transporter ATP-binding protein [Nocardioidaceae bacterium]